MCNKEFSQAIKRLQAQRVIVAIEPTKRHWRLTLSNGRIYTCASTPSDWRAVRNMLAGIRRMSRLTSFKPGATVEALNHNGAPR